MLAQQAQVRQRGGATLLPRDDVMGVTIGRRPVASGEHTSLVTGMQRLPDGWGDEPMLLANIEHPGRSAQHHGQDVGVTRDPIELFIQRTLRIGTDTFRPEPALVVVLSETGNTSFFGQHL